MVVVVVVVVLISQKCLSLYFSFLHSVLVDSIPLT